jgi:MGT family glycosyltransferase
MPRFLFVPVPVTGHVGPALTLARGVAARGHEVTVYTGARYRSTVERAGARHVPFQRAADVELERLNELFPDRPAKPGLTQALWDLKRLVVDAAEEQFADLEPLVDQIAPDAVLSDVMAVSGQLVAEKRGLPSAVLNPLNLFSPSCDTFPDGFGIAPSATALGRVRNRVANWLVNRVALRDANVHFHRLRERLGLRRVAASLMEMPMQGSQLWLQPTAPAFEYPRSDLPPHVHFIGPLLPLPPTGWSKPHWWPELMRGRKVVLVTQGTIATNFDDLLRPAIAALASDEDLVVVATTGNRPSTELSDRPAHVFIEPFVPFGEVMPFVDVMVTNGGYGGIHHALTHGVPLVVAGQTEDKVETSARVAWAGVGINLKSNRPGVEQLRQAVRTVLRTPSYRERARSLQKALAELDAPTRGAELLERLAVR